MPFTQPFPVGGTQQQQFDWLFAFADAIDQGWRPQSNQELNALIQGAPQSFVGQLVDTLGQLPEYAPSTSPGFDAFFSAADQPGATAASAQQAFDQNVVSGVSSPAASTQPPPTSGLVPGSANLGAPTAGFSSSGWTVAPKYASLGLNDARMQELINAGTLVNTGSALQWSPTSGFTGDVYTKTAPITNPTYYQGTTGAPTTNPTYYQGATGAQVTNPTYNQPSPTVTNPTYYQGATGAAVTNPTYVQPPTVGTDTSGMVSGSANLGAPASSTPPQSGMPGYTPPLGWKQGEMNSALPTTNNAVSSTPPQSGMVPGSANLGAPQISNPTYNQSGSGTTGSSVSNPTYYQGATGSQITNPTYNQPPWASTVPWSTIVGAPQGTTAPSGGLVPGSANLGAPTDYTQQLGGIQGSINDLPAQLQMAVNAGYLTLQDALAQQQQAYSGQVSALQGSINDLPAQLQMAVNSGYLSLQDALAQQQQAYSGQVSGLANTVGSLQGSINDLPAQLQQAVNAGYISLQDALAQQQSAYSGQVSGLQTSMETQNKALQDQIAALTAQLSTENTSTADRASALNSLATAFGSYRGANGPGGTTTNAVTSTMPLGWKQGEMNSALPTTTNAVTSTMNPTQEPAADLGGDQFVFNPPTNQFADQTATLQQSLFDMLSGGKLPAGYEDIMAGVRQNQSSERDQAEQGLYTRGLANSTLGTAERNKLGISQRAEEASTAMGVKSEALKQALGLTGQITNEYDAARNASLNEFLSLLDRQYRGDVTQATQDQQMLALLMNAMGISTITPTMPNYQVPDTTSTGEALGGLSGNVLTSLLSNPSIDWGSILGM